MFSQSFLLRGALLTAPLVLTAQLAAQEPVPIRYGFLWHMHQPNYYPYEMVTDIDAAGYYSFSVTGVHNSRHGAYSTWPRDAVRAGHDAGLPHLGASVSFTGALIENLNHLRDVGVGGGMWNNWEDGYFEGIDLQTSLGNSRLDMVAFGYHHPLAPLLDERDMRMQIQLHKHIYNETWDGLPYSKGMFPAENAFSVRMIPWLVAEGIDWVMVDNIHFDRACQNYPHTNQSSIYPPNRADQINPDPSQNGGAWIQLRDLWAPSRVSVPFGYQPHHVQYVDPESGETTRMIAVPTARYEGNEDGRGGFGALQYETVMSQYLNYNTDPERPMLVMLHHDGDNHGGGSESYYHSNFQNMIAWDQESPDYEGTTVDDYLERFPVPEDALIHVEPGSWAGADAGDPEFKKWLGDPDENGWSPDRNSWAVMTAARNRVFHADDAEPFQSLDGILEGNGTPTENAWHFLLCGQASDYWYWDNSGEPWDSNVTRAANQAVVHADIVIERNPGADETPPAVFTPQREPYNPGGYEWAPTPMPNDFEVWTYAYDVNGLESVTLRWRIDNDGFNPLDSIQNETFAGGDEVNDWQEIAMAEQPDPPIPGAANILPATYRASQYSAMITGQSDVLIDYYVEAVDNEGNVYRSDIFHVYVGEGQQNPGEPRVTLEPETPVAGAEAQVRYDDAGGPLGFATEVNLHWGVNGWQNPTDTPMTYDETNERWEVSVLIPQNADILDVVFNDGQGAWDNNNGEDWHFAVQQGTPAPSPTPTPSPTGPTPTVTPSPTPEPMLPNPFNIDGAIDGTACLLPGGLYLARQDGWLYVAGEAEAPEDLFVYLTTTPDQPSAANWAKDGEVARWDFFLAREGSNDYVSWFGANGAVDGESFAVGVSGSVAEGAIRLSELPSGAIYVALGRFETDDGGSLDSQSPPGSDGDADIDAGEYHALPPSGDPCQISATSIQEFWLIQ